MPALKKYPSDVTREKFNKIEPFLQEIKKKTKPRKLDLFSVFNAILYVLKTGCQWAALPSEYPDYRRVHYYFMLWQKHKVFDKILKELTVKTRTQNKRTAKTSFGIIDAQSVKNTDTAGKKGHNAGKKVSGIKRHIIVDTDGLPHGIYVTTADITDRDGAIELVKGNNFGSRQLKRIFSNQI